MRYILLLLLPLFISCSTTSDLKEFTTPPKHLYKGSFHKSYQYYVVTNVCKPAPQDMKGATHTCDMGLELHYFVDGLSTVVLSEIAGKWSHLFEFSLAPEFKVEGENNEVSISNALAGKWYKFEEKTIGVKSLLWIRVNYEVSGDSASADVVFDLSDPTKPKLVFADEATEDDDKDQSWADIKKRLKLK